MCDFKETILFKNSLNLFGIKPNIMIREFDSRFFF